MSAMALSLRRASSRASRSAPALLASGSVLALIVVCVAAAPLLAPHDPLALDIARVYQGPSATNPLGTDANGRDLLSRLIFGGRTALVGPLVVSGISTCVGTALAVTAAWKRGWVDTAISRSMDMLFAFPGLLLAILAAATFGKGLMAATFALALSYTPYVGRVLRSAAITHLGMPYITALRANGFGGLHIAYRHVLPNLRPLILSQAAIMFGYSMIDLAAVSFLGLGVQQPTPDWGGMVAAGLPSILSGYPQEALLASALIVVTVVAVNLVAERLGDGTEVKK